MYRPSFELLLFVKKLNTSAISFYVNQIGFDPSFVLLGGVIPFSALKGLRIAFSIKSIDRITCILPRECAKELREIQCWLNRLSSIRVFHLAFVTTSPPLAHLHLGERYYCRIPEPALITEFVRTVYNKQCIDFRIAGDIQINEQICAGVSTLSTLMVADRGTTAFLLPPLVDWTLCVLNGSSNLRTLTIQNILQLDSFIFTHLKLPALQTLHIATSVVWLCQLLPFFSEHPALQTVSLVGVYTCPRLPSRRKSTFIKMLPNVTTLTTSFTTDIAHELLMYFLDSFVKLDHIILTNDKPQNGPPGNVAGFLGAYLDVIFLRPHIKSLSLVLTDMDAITPWLRVPWNVHSRLNEHRLYAIAYLTLECIERSVVDLLPPRLTFFPRLKKFTMRRFQWRDEDDIVCFVRLIKKMCIGLKEVSLSSTCTKSLDDWLKLA